ncbi:hypothetical protein Tco_0427775 [Tanacetum coccineum]
MEDHLTSTQPTQVNKITTSCEICSGPHDTQYCMEDPEQAFVEYASSRTDEAGEEDGDVMFIEIVPKDDNSRKEELMNLKMMVPLDGERRATTKDGGSRYFDTFLTRDELTYHKYLMCGPILSTISRETPSFWEGYPFKPQIPCNTLGTVHGRESLH